MPRRFLKIDPVPEITYPAFIKQIPGTGVPAPGLGIVPGTNNTWGAWAAVTQANSPGVNFIACMICLNFLYSRDFKAANQSFRPLYHIQAGVGPSGSERAIAEICLSHQMGLGTLTNADSGTATLSAPTTMTEATKKWPVNGYTGLIVTMGGSTGNIASNTATVLTIDAWTPLAPTTGAYTISGFVTIQLFMNYAIPIAPVLIPGGSRVAFRATTEDSNALGVTAVGMELIGYDASEMPPLYDESILWKDASLYMAGARVLSERDAIFRSCSWPPAGSGVADAGKVILATVPNSAMSAWGVAIPENTEPYPIIIEGVVTSGNPAGGSSHGIHVEVGLGRQAGAEQPYSRAYFADGGASAGNVGRGGGYAPLCRPLLVPAGARVSVRARTAISSDTNQQVVLVGERVGR